MVGGHEFPCAGQGRADGEVAINLCNMGYLITTRNSLTFHCFFIRIDLKSFRKEIKMKKEKTKKELKKDKYLKPVLTKHRKLRDVTAGVGTNGSVLGCTRF